MLVPSALVIIYGDSIAAGYNAADREWLGWAGRLRAYNIAPMRDTTDGLRLTSQVGTAADATRVVARWLRHRPTDVWLAVGSNDAFAGVPVATFKTAYGYVLDELAAVAPHVKVWAQTPIVRIGEAAINPPLADYRTAIAQLCDARPRVTLVDGTALVSLADLDVDGTHLTTNGHSAYASNVIPILGWDR